MLFDKLIEDSKKYWSDYFSRITLLQSQGNLVSVGGEILYPNMLLATEFDGFYAIELVGASKKFNGLTLKKHRENSIYRYLSQFDAESNNSLLHLNSANNTFRFFTLAQDTDLQEARRRFPFMELYKSVLIREGGSGSLFSFGDEFRSCAIENSALLNKKGNLFRCKSILSLFIFKKNISSKEVIDLYIHCNKDHEISGIHTANHQEQKILIGGALQSMVLMPGLRETTIGDYINKHPEIIKEAFKTESFLYEPEFLWIEHDGTCDDFKINPDLMLKRSDGFYDILDLKTALLDKSKITKSGRSRRRFIDVVNEGIAQLANYREYFKYKGNQEFAFKKYGIKVQSPNMILVVGSWDNVNADEVLQASRAYSDITIIDYDTLCHTFIGSNEN